ncbi:uncharacterized protein LOC116190166 [Punica granatum]|uniref:Uncharacterized protein n=2 Tax=Punica granatum TaxID=22663 RepID=A0A2I0HMA4_PUNGR|nr:uncharacterized protein LOC116190166 [Punica granatum]PKI32845.1 hypothetical protein CRG98_046754 [Punica granatum]
MFGESFRVISARKKLFGQITLALILPLCVFFLAHLKVTQLILENTIKTDGGHWIDYDENNGEYEVLYNKKYSWAVILVIKVVYLNVVLILSLIATSAVVYTVACVYTFKDGTFRKVISIMPKVWMRLVITFLRIFIVLVVYNLIFVGLFFQCLLFARVIAIALAIILVVAYIAGIVHVTIVWESACVVSILEEYVYGRKAMPSSKALLKGEIWSVICFFVLLTMFFGLVELGFEFLVVVWLVIKKSVAIRVMLGVVFWFVLALETLVRLVAFTVN